MRSEYFESANSFTYNGINSLDMGLFITGQSAADSAAEPEIETVEVPRWTIRDLKITSKNIHAV